MPGACDGASWLLRGVQGLPSFVLLCLLFLMLLREKEKEGVQFFRSLGGNILFENYLRKVSHEQPIKILRLTCDRSVLREHVKKERKNQIDKI